MGWFRNLFRGPIRPFVIAILAVAKRRAKTNVAKTEKMTDEEKILVNETIDQFTLEVIGTAEEEDAK